MATDSEREEHTPIEMPHPDALPDGFLSDTPLEGEGTSDDLPIERAPSNISPDNGLAVINNTGITQVPLSEEEERLEEELQKHFGPHGCHTCND